MAAAQDAQKARKWQEVLAKTREAESTPVAKIAVGSVLDARIPRLRVSQLGSPPKRRVSSKPGSHRRACRKPTSSSATRRSSRCLLRRCAITPRSSTTRNRALKVARDPEMQVDVGQAYYQTSDNKERRAHHERSHGRHRADAARSRRNSSCCWSARPARRCRTTPASPSCIEKLVMYYPKPEYWQNLHRVAQGMATPTTCRRSTSCASRCTSMC